MATLEPAAMSPQAARDTLQTGFSEDPEMGRWPDCPGWPSESHMLLKSKTFSHWLSEEHVTTEAWVWPATPREQVPDSHCVSLHSGLSVLQDRPHFFFSCCSAPARAVYAQGSIHALLCLRFAFFIQLASMA